MKGTFKGVVVQKDVQEPSVRTIGEYDTVYYGTLQYFVLVVPEEAEVEQIPVSDISDIIIIKKHNVRWCYKITYGDAMFPDKLTPISCP
jgi:hypothetical protein